MNINKTVVMVLAGIGVLGLVGWWVMRSGTTPEAVQNGSQPTVEVEAVPTSEIAETTQGLKEFTVSGKNFRFDPAEIRVKQGDTVRVLFKSEDMTHDFTLDEFEVATDQLSAGEDEEVEFTANKAGTFEYYCSVGQHRANGMVGKLIVE